MARKRKVPQTRYPMNMEKSYMRTLNRLILSWRKIAQWYVNDYLKHYVSGGAVSFDNANDKNEPQDIERIATVITLMTIAIKNARTKSFEDIASSFVLSVNGFSFSNCSRQANAIAIKAVETDSTIQTFIKAKIKENTSYITSLRDDYISQLRNDIYRSISDGGGATQLTQIISKRTGMAYNRAKLIANDQTGSILSQLNAYRAQRAGFAKYRWQSMEDDRVRPKHQELDQQIFRYDDPDGGDSGELPGEPINCRCVATPVVED